jgi:hypothetical protein
MIFFLLACLQFPDTDEQTQDSDTGTVGACPSGFVEAQASTVVVNNFTVDGLPLYAVAEVLCVGEDGLSMQAELLISDEPGSIAMSAQDAGSVNLPDSSVVVTLVQDSTWSSADIYAGTSSLNVSTTDVLGDLQFEATNADGDQVSFGMSWSGAL